MSQLMPEGEFLSFNKKGGIIDPKEEKYRQPEGWEKDYGEPGKDTPKTIEEKWRKNPIYKWGKITVTEMGKENGKNVYRVEFHPRPLSTDEHDTRKKELDIFFANHPKFDPTINIFNKQTIWGGINEYKP